MAQVLQWPAAVRGGAVLPPSWFVTSLDLAATLLDAAGLAPPGAPPLQNAGGPLNGRSLLPLLALDTLPRAAGGAASAAGGAAATPDGAVGADGAAAAGGAAAAEASPPEWWRSSLWFELGVAGALKHVGGWQARRPATTSHDLP